MLYRVYIDEAGDRGIAARSSAHFVVSAVIVADADERALRAYLANMRLSVNRRANDELHFQKLTHSDRLKVTLDLGLAPIAAITTAILVKQHLYSSANYQTAAHIAQPDPMYLWALRLLLERVSWFCDGPPTGNAIVTFAHIKRFKAQKLYDYRSALEQTPGVQIRWPVFAGHSWHIDQPKNIELLQLADAAASAAFKAVESDAHGFTEPRYLAHLKPVLYRRNSGNITSYGLKVFPPVACGASGSLAFLTTF